MPPDRLDDLIGHVVARLGAALTARDAAWRTPMLATLAGADTPTLRTVVMRTLDPASRQIRINTDRRSAKAVQLTVSPRVELGFWDPGAGEQLRVAGLASISRSDEVIAPAWWALTAEGRRVFRASADPGTPIAGPDPEGDSAGSRDALAVITLTWARWDWLWLSRDGHRRAIIAWHDNGAVEASWVTP